MIGKKFLFLGLTIALPAVAADKITPQQAEFFENKVRPVLADNCYRCHGEKKKAGGLRADSLAALLQGGDSGPSIVPGDPDKSKLVQAIRYTHDDMKMPPSGKMKQEAIDAIVEWVKMGAPWPDAHKEAAPVPETKAWEITEKQRQWWSLQPIKKAAPPKVKNAKWVESPIDAFILQRLESVGLKPAPPADKRTLIRRAYFDLIGLPPTPEEVEDFIEDKAPDAWEKLIDRLLANPHYGERWGRRWLDVARYADSNGLDENTAFGNAWRYRDYVVASLNADKPYDRFLKEQIAGDLLPSKSDEERNTNLTATAFLSLGPKVLAEPDKPKLAMDIVDEQIDTTSKAVLGLTISCARCHDHKFDPIPTKDYYALAGIFKSTRTMQNLNTVAKVYERPLASPEVEAEIKAKKEIVKKHEGEVKKITDAANSELVKGFRKDWGKYVLAGWELARQGGLYTIGDTPPKPGDAQRHIIEAEKYARGNFLKNFDSYGKEIGVIHTGGGSSFAEWDIELPEAGLYQLELRYTAMQSRPVRLKLNDKTIIEDAATGVTGSWNPDGQKWEAQGVLECKQGKNILRLESKGDIPHLDKWLIVKAKPEDAAAPKRNEAQIAGARKLNPTVLKEWAKILKPLLDEEPFKVWNALSIAPAAEFNEAAQKLTAQLNGDGAEFQPVREAVKGKNNPFKAPPKAEELYPKETKELLAKANDELKKAQEAVPDVPMVIAVDEAEKIENVKVHIRGSTQNLGDEAPRRFLTVLEGENQKPLSEKSSGRLELAEWITKAENPLTPRVMANRVWLGHFGEGLVRTPDNFGLMGEKPSHPELLDYLAGSLRDNGWSLKKLHREIMLSNAYQMSSLSDAKAMEIDPDNRLVWRMNRRRLEAEPLRDSLLYVAGNLDPKMGGTLLASKNFDYVTNDQSRNAAQYDKPVRSIYLPVIRNAVFDLFQAFDFGDPSFTSGQRATTTVAPQALYLMNSPFVLQQAKTFAESLLKVEKQSDAQRIETAYRRAYGRMPTTEEARRADDFLTRYSAHLEASEPDATARRLKAFTGLCQVILASNEFVYVN